MVINLTIPGIVMKSSQVTHIVSGIPFTNEKRGELLFQFILEQRFKDCLELGVAHGKATSYIAAALDELGEGQVTGVDLDKNSSENLIEKLSRLRVPTQKESVLPEELLQRCGLAKYVQLVYEPTSYNWFLMEKIREQSKEGLCTPCYDFCFLDGRHDWFVDGFAFCLVDKLLRPGGWIIFDDVYWSFSRSILLKDTAEVQAMPKVERETPPIKLIIELLVAQHPNYEMVLIDEEWGYAKKKATLSESSTCQVIKTTSDKVLSLV